MLSPLNTKGISIAKETTAGMMYPVLTSLQYSYIARSIKAANRITKLIFEKRIALIRIMIYTRPDNALVTVSFIYYYMSSSRRR